MHPCHACRRHVRSDASTCPFCHAVLRHDVAPAPRIAGLLLGLTMMSCGGGDDESTATTNATTMSTTVGTSESTGTGTSTTNDDNGVSVAAYGDPSFDDSSISEPPETSIAESSTSGDESSTGTGTGSSDSTGTSESSGSSSSGG